MLIKPYFDQQPIHDFALAVRCDVILQTLIFSNISGSPCVKYSIVHQ